MTLTPTPSRAAGLTEVDTAQPRVRTSVAIGVIMAGYLMFFGTSVITAINIEWNDIYYGGRNVLEHAGVKSIQVETHPAQKACLYHYMDAFGYTAQSVHYTQNGQKAIDKGAKPESVVCNTIFRRGE